MLRLPAFFLAACSLIACATSSVTTPITTEEPIDASWPKTRDIQKWPFAAGSIWNMPIGSSAQYVAANVAAPPYWGVLASEDILVLTPDAPPTDVYENFSDWNDASPEARCSKQGKWIAKLPMPTNFVYPHDGKTPDAASAILQSDGRTLFQSQPFQRCVAGEFATSHYVFDAVDIYGDGRLGAHGGSGLSSIGGTIRVGEIVAGGEIRHALKIYVWANKYIAHNQDGTPGFRWPASKADGGASNFYGGNNAALEMGALLALKPTADVSKLKTEPGRIIAKALQNYGAYVVDNAGSENIAFAVERGTNGRMQDDFKTHWGYEFSSPRQTTVFAQDLALLWPQLQVINNNDAGNVGGGGKPRRPLAPSVKP